MPLQIPIPKVEAPKISVSGNLPKFTTTPTVSVSNSGFSAPSSNNLINVSSLSSGGIKTSVAPALNLKSITPSVNLGGKVNLSVDTLKTLGTKAGMTATIGAAAAAMNIPLGLPSTTDALKTFGVPTDLASLQKALNFELPKIPAFPGLNFALLIGKSPQFIAEVVLKYKTICLPHIPGVKINMAQALAAISILKAVASGNAGAIVKHLIEGIVDEIKGELIQNLQESINAGLKETEASLKQVIDQAANFEVGIKVKEQKQEYDPDTGEPIPLPVVEKPYSGDSIDLSGSWTTEPVSTEENPIFAENSGTFSQNLESNFNAAMENSLMRNITNNVDGTTPPSAQPTQAEQPTANSNSATSNSPVENINNAFNNAMENNLMQNIINNVTTPPPPRG